MEAEIRPPPEGEGVSEVGERALICSSSACSRGVLAFLAVCSERISRRSGHAGVFCSGGNSNIICCSAAAEKQSIRQGVCMTESTWQSCGGSSSAPPGTIGRQRCSVCSVIPSSAGARDTNRIQSSRAQGRYLPPVLCGWMTHCCVRWTWWKDGNGIDMIPPED